MPTDDPNPWDAPADDDSAPEATAAPGPAPVGDDEPTTDEPTTDGPAGDEGGADGTGAEDRRRVLVIAGVAFVVIAAIAFVLTRGDDDTTTSDDDRTSVTSQPADGGGQAIAIAGTPDTFDRDDTGDGLGALPSGAEWVVQSGGWAVQGGQAVVTQPDPERRNTVYVATGYADPQAQVRMATVAVNAGMVFRYQGECNYWAVYAVPEFATWNVEKVIDCERVGEGDSQVYRTITQAPVADGTNVGVVLRGEEVRIVLNGRVVLTFQDPDLAGVGRVGLTSKGPAPVVFDDFIAGGPEGQGIIGGTTAPDDGAPTEPTEPADGATTAPADGDGGG